MQQFLLDKTDRKILYFLDINARMSNLQIAKKIRISREVVDYRIRRLLKNQIINRFFTHIRAEKLGFTIYKLHLAIKGLQNDEERNLINYFVEHQNVYRVTSCDGIYDMTVSLTAKDVYELYKMLKEVYHKYDINILVKDTLISTIVYHGRREYLIKKNRKEIEPLIRGGEKGNIILDKIDTEILKILANNARTHILDIARQLGLTSSAVIYRIKGLKEKNIIEAYRCSINVEKIGYIRCKVFLSLNFIEAKKEKELHQYCLENPSIIFFWYCIGHCDLEVELEIENTAAFHDLLKEIKTRFSDIIRKCEYVIISTEYKFDHFPGCYPTKLSNYI